MEIYSKEMIKEAKDKIKLLIDIVHNLEDMFKGRHFTLDGHLVGSIGEVIGSHIIMGYHYIRLQFQYMMANDLMEERFRNI